MGPAAWLTWSFKNGENSENALIRHLSHQRLKQGVEEMLKAVKKMEWDAYLIERFPAASLNRLTNFSACRSRLSAVRCR